MEFDHVSHNLYFDALLLLINAFSQKIFESLGFSFKEAQADEPVGTLVPPSIDGSTPSGKLNRERLLRAWVEMGSYAEEFRRRYGERLNSHAKSFFC